MKRAYVPAGASRDGPMGFIKLGFGAKKVQPTYIQKCIFEAYDGLQWRVFLDLDTALESVGSHSIMTFPARLCRCRAEKSSSYLFFRFIAVVIVMTVITR